ncbi:DUF6298 domain-containing protein [Rufibacter latericius]|uniref:DUF6298 domain-containing protein n=1 Tax=Rufibacter latericius TaxID=2487040 RepID=A0A3M9M8U9_9BACT|nr:DUF6298 domain-containing protein [Rufibacter latericius]RNI21972.1 hypothetical protein EFB08_22825 [Rufibacter latericius]
MKSIFGIVGFCAVFWFLGPKCFAQNAPGIDSIAAKIDFSYAGFQAGSRVPPRVPAVLQVRPSEGDDTRLLQAAIDYVEALPLQKNGFRGAIQLMEGRYKIAGQLLIKKAGVVIRGGANRSKVVLIATGKGRRALIKVGVEDTAAVISSALQVKNLVPAGAREVTLENIPGLLVGDHVLVTRPSTANWIADLGMTKAEGMFVAVRGLRWPTGSRDLTWHRKITQVDPKTNHITLDGPITIALEPQYGGGTVQKVVYQNLVHSVGLEGFTIESEYSKANPLDEDHAWIGIHINHAQDVWVRDVTARHFVSSAIRVGDQARQVSLLNCRSEQPVSEIGGYRRMSFLVDGQQVLVENCTSDSGLNDFAVGFCAAGPNAFLNCKATNALGASGSFESWASGVLYENVTIEKAGLKLTYDEDRAQAGGWTAANSVIWNSKAKAVEAWGPTSYQNHVVQANYSLYQTQLAKRLSKANTVANKKTIGYGKQSGSLKEFTLKEVGPEPAVVKPETHPLQIVNGRFVINSKVIWSGTVGDQFWRGQAFPGGELNSGVSLTRFVPGKDGPGLTEVLPKLAQNMVQQDTRFHQAMTGLWYDRRRDDHSIKPREDGNVWAPFYEMPWARSGKGKAWDGLSKFDLTTFNPWFFARSKEFARLCDENGLVLYYSLYNTHNLLEYVTHWVDYPWRPTNAVNKIDLPEPLPAEPWARLHLGNEFYDATNPTLRDLHRSYIFHVLDELGTSQNIIFNLGFQFAGPLAFQRFFLETIAEWETRNQRNVRVVLTTSKDITDAILAEAVLARQVDVIDTRYWQYRPEGLFSNGDSLWAPPGGNNRSYREMVGEAFLQASDYPLPTTQELLYRQVREYTRRFPDKAVVAIANDISPIPALMAGGAQVVMGSSPKRGNCHVSFSSFVQQHLAEELMNLKPNDVFLQRSEQNWCLANPDNSTLLLYSLSGADIQFSEGLPDGAYTGTWYDPLSESLLPKTEVQLLRRGTSLKKPSKANWLLLLKRK